MKEYVIGNDGMQKNVRTDCFGYNKMTKSCTPLRVMDCKNCHFYKTKKQFEEEQKKYGTCGYELVEKRSPNGNKYTYTRKATK